MEAAAPPPVAPPPAAPAAGGYPVRFDLEHPERLSRWRIFLKPLLAYPVMLVLVFLQYGLFIQLFFTWWVILFKKRHPRGGFSTIVWLMRWNAGVNIYVYLLRDDYPAFSGEPGAYSPLTLEVDEPAELSRGLIFVKWLLAIPHYIVLMVLGIVAAVVTIVAWFAILFTGKYPRGMFNFVVGVMRWSMRVNAYAFLLLTDKYPPFSLE